MRKVIFGFIYLLCVFSVCAQGARLLFNQGNFRILQLTDLHLMPGNTAGCDSTERTVRAIVKAEKPQLIVLTGDIVTGEPAAEGWQRVLRLFDSLGTPYAVTFGNHDGEYVSKPDITAMLARSPLYAASATKDAALPIYGSDGSVKAVVYVIDSNDYPADKRHGSYDRIHFDQIAHYRNVSQSFTTANNGTPLPSVAFFHIPLHEHGRVLSDDATIGSRLEGAGATAEVNSGIFASFVDCGDIMGAFTGHDHENDYVGQYQGIALGFGRCTGTDAYGSLPRGARVIDLYEGQRKFDTYIATPATHEATYYYPSGLNSAEADTMYYHPAIKAKPRRPGVSYEYYEGLMKHTSQVDSCQLVAKGTMPYFDITQAPAEDHFAYKFLSFINIPERGVYKFYTHSDDGSVLRIDGQTVVDNDGGHSARRREGKIALEAGLHRLELLYFENYMGQELEVGFASRNLPETPIPAEWLFIAL